MSLISLALVLSLAAAEPAIDAGPADPAPAAPPASPGLTPVPFPQTAGKGDSPPAAGGEKKASPPATVTGSPGNGATITSADGNFSLNLKGRVQLRDTFTNLVDRQTNELAVRTVRLQLAGNTFSPKLKYGLQLAFGSNDFEAGVPSPVFDAFVEYEVARDVTVKAGQYFVPFDRARTVRESSLQLVDRQQPVTELNLDRDVGVSLSSSNLLGLDHLLSYNLGIFGGEGRNRNAAIVPGFLYVGRVALRPFGVFDDEKEGDLKRLPNPRLAIGAAAARNVHSVRQRSTIGNVFTTATVNYSHLAADLVFKWRGLSLLAEWIARQASADSLSATIDGKTITEATRSGRGAFVQGGYMLTSELEVVGRYARLIATGSTDAALRKLAAEQGSELGGGLNLYLNEHMLKVQADAFTFFGPTAGNSRQAVRLQLDVTF